MHAHSLTKLFSEYIFFFFNYWYYFFFLMQWFAFTFSLFYQAKWHVNKIALDDCLDASLDIDYQFSFFIFYFHLWSKFFIYSFFFFLSHLVHMYTINSWWIREQMNIDRLNNYVFAFFSSDNPMKLVAIFEQIFFFSNVIVCIVY